MRKFVKGASGFLTEGARKPGQGEEDGEFSTTRSGSITHSQSLTYSSIWDNFYGTLPVSLRCHVKSTCGLYLKHFADFSFNFSFTLADELDASDPSNVAFHG